MSRLLLPILLALPTIALFDSAASGLLPQENAESRARTGISVWDTNQASSSPLSLHEKAGWTEVPADSAGAPVKGDAVFTNGKITAAVRKNAAAVELYGAGDAPRVRMVLESAGGETLVRLDQVTVAENAKGAAALQIVGRTEKGAEVAAKVRLKRSEVAVETEPGPGADRLRIECLSRFVVLPDFFADDIVLDSTKLPADAVDLPSENVLVHLLGGGDALAACVFENRDQEARVYVSGKGDRRRVAGAELQFGKGRRIWVALLEGQGLWHSLEIGAKDAGKTLPLEWRMPFPAAWRVDFTRTTELTDSWEMLLQEKEEGGYLKPSWMGRGSDRVKRNRRRWTTVLGDFTYPCWSDVERRGYLEPLKNRAAKFEGPAVLYPINRVPQTPLEAFTVVDVMRNTLGVGPCQYILDLDGQRSEYKGQGGCDTRDQLNAIYSKGEQKAKRGEIEKALRDVHVCISYVNGRILHYLEFAKKTHEWIEGEKKAKPELSGFLSDMDKMVGEIDARWAARSDKIRNPGFVLKISDEFRKEVLEDDGPDALDKCKKFTKSIVEVADNQDEMLGECRWALRALRQRAGLQLAKDPKVASASSELRARVQEAMRNPASLEGARH